MPAPKKNLFWMQRSKHGRDAIFTDPAVLLAAAREYFEWNAANPWMQNEAIKSGEKAGKVMRVPVERPLTLEGLTSFLGVNKQYFSDFEKRLTEKDKDFSLVICHIREVIGRQQTEGAIVGTFNGNIISRLLGLVDKSSMDFNAMTDEQLDAIIDKLVKKHE